MLDHGNILLVIYPAGLMFLSIVKTLIGEYFFSFGQPVVRTSTFYFMRQILGLICI